MQVPPVSNRLRTVAIALLAAFALLGIAEACNVPVFRFALERWRADPYEVVLLHRGPLAADQEKLLQPLVDQQDMYLANVAVRTVDVGQIEEAEDKQLLAALGEDSPLPRLVVQYPRHLRNPTPVWSGPLTRESVASLSDSPVRKEIVKRLAAGQTAVWVLLESGDAERDEAAAKLLASELKKLEAELKLPELTDAPEDSLLAGPPLKLGFSTLRIKRSDPAEAPLVNMLIHSEPDLAERSDPMIFPIFGRGRVLFPLIGAGITAENLFDCAAFLVGACSCEVKELNPGFDLLLAAEWDVLLFEGAPPTSVMTRNPAAPQGEPTLVPIPGGSKATIATPTSTSASVPSSPRSEFNRTVMFVGGSGFALALLMIACIAGVKR